MNYLDEVLEVMYKARAFGSRILENGAELLGHVPHVAPQAWLHEIYPSLDSVGINHIESSLGRSLPPMLKAFYSKVNGLSIFSDSMAIYGCRLSGGERTADAVRQPFDIGRPNGSERPDDAKESFIFIGSYSYDGSKLYVDITTNGVCRSLRYQSLEVLNSWPSLEIMLSSEVQRLETLFDDKGRQINPNRPTVPNPTHMDVVTRN